MPPTPVKTPALPVPEPPAPRVRKASVASVLNQPKASTAQALKGFHYLRSNSSRIRQLASPS